MQSGRTRVPRRAIVAAFALYALLVQALLAGFAPVTASPRPDAGAGLLCAHGSSGGSSRDAPLPDEHGCCLAACSMSGLAGPALPPSAAIAWPCRQAGILVWDGAALAPGARHAAAPLNARGPPSA